MPTAIAGRRNLVNAANDAACRVQYYDTAGYMTMSGAQACEGSREVLVSLADGKPPISLGNGELPVSIGDGELPVSLGNGELPGNVSRQSPPKAEPVIWRHVRKHIVKLDKTA